MPTRKEVQDGRPPLKPGVIEPAKARIRIGRACDRCKIKKSKCDGNIPCSACIASDSSCEYSARRRREARDWYLGMQDVIDEALQRLYWACRQGRGFPGVVPDESSGRVSTDAILRGLGLSPPPVDNARPGGLDTQAQLPIPRSYHPPDIQPRREEASAIDVDENSDLADGTATDSLADGLPDGLDPELRAGMDAKMNSSATQGGLVGYMGAPLYSDPGEMHFADGLPQHHRDRQMPMPPVAQYEDPSLDQQRLEPVRQSLGTMEQSVWHGQHDHETGGALPWPGNMASMSRRREDRGDKGGLGDDAGKEQ